MPIAQGHTVTARAHQDPATPASGRTAGARRAGWPALLVGGLTLLLGGCATVPSEDRVAHDPLEPLNRQVFAFNEGLDRVLVRPAAEVYTALPQPVQTGTGNFLNNLRDVTTFANNLLQLKFLAAVEDFMRVSINTVFGFGGLIDLASEMGLTRHNEDFGQTLGHYGVGAGPYLVLPFLGPSNPRDLTGFVVDGEFFDPRFRLTRDRDALRYSLLALSIVETRARLLSTEDLLRSISDDRYVAIREAYIQRREFLIRDGAVDLDDGLLDELDELDALDDDVSQP